jgi:predicted dehydrogenase
MACEGERDGVVESFRQWLRAHWHDPKVKHEMQRLVDLARKGDLDLVCWCAPKACHGDVIKRAIEAVLDRS